MVIPDARRAVGFASRARGLIGRPPLAETQGFWFDRCAAVHCLGMRYPIDVVHLGRDDRVLLVAEGVRPWRWSTVRGGRAVLELAAGVARQSGISPGQVLKFVRQEPPGFNIETTENTP